MSDNRRGVVVDTGRDRSAARQQPAARTDRRPLHPEGARQAGRALDICRHDFNPHPVQYWGHGEPDDRQGRNEIRYIMGLYEYFDALRREHPHLIIDSSASGGRRIDFEMLSGRSRSGGATSPGSPSSGIWDNLFLGDYYRSPGTAARARSGWRGSSTARTRAGDWSRRSGGAGPSSRRWSSGSETSTRRCRTR